MTGGKAQQRASREVQRFKVAGIVLAAIVVWSSLIPLFGVLLEARIYNLSPRARQVVGKPNSNLSAKFSYNGSINAWQFNREGIALKADMIAEQQGSSDPGGVASALSQMQQQVGGGGKDDKSLYSVNLPEDGSKAVTYYDNNTQQSFKMTPQFDLRDGKLKNGQVVYPLYGGGQLVYTAKTNGLKEDIVLERSLGDNLDFSYDLDLPKTLEARLQNDGSIGVFSADMALYGNISASSDMDQAKLDSARETAPKDNLLFALPAPVIKDAKGVEKPGKFSLKGETLTVHATGLEKLAYPISVDPSVVVTSSADFLAGNDHGAIDYSTSGQIGGMRTTGGSVGTWVSATNPLFVGAAWAWTDSTAYNGYAYVAGRGGAGAASSHVSYATINSDGTFGVWTATTPLPANRNAVASLAYNGYLYALGGNNAGTQFADVWYSKINSNGTIGSWQTGTSLPAVTGMGKSFVINNYIYYVGGSNSSNVAQTAVRYAPIRANGSIGSWSTTTSLPAGRTQLGLQYYNGYVYAMGGATTYNDNDTPMGTVIFAKVNSDGTIGSWQTGTSMNTGRAAFGSAVYNGYLYVLGGRINSSGTTTATVEYAPVLANGEMGEWRTTTSLGSNKFGTTSFAYNNRLYLLGGDPVGNSNTFSVPINPAGVTTAWTTSGNNIGTAVSGNCTIAYNGYLYKIGGSTNGSDGSNVTTVRRAAITSGTGAVGTWSDTTALPAVRGFAGCVAYNDKIYVTGGYGTGSGTATNTVYYITVNSDGTLAGSWTTGANTLTSTLFRAWSFVYTTPDGTTRLYAVGQLVNHMRAYMSTLDSSGVPGTWSLASDQDPGGAALDRAVYTNVGDKVYAHGVYSSSAAQTATYYIPIASNGTFTGSWTSTGASLPSAVASSTGTVVNGCIYVVGGYNGGSLASVYYACPSSSGTISAWNTAPSIALGTADAGVTSFGGYVYAAGGFTTATISTVQYAKVNNGGSGNATGAAWQADSDIAVVDNRFRHATVVYNGYIYMIGGSVNGGGAITTQTVEYAPINADGTLGAWVADTHELPTARYFPGTVAYNGYMYVLGGQDASSNFLKSILYAPISSTGALSANWSSAGSDTTNGGAGASMAAHNGYLYSLGGWDGSTDYNTVQYAPINSNGTIGSWSSTSSFTTSRSDLTSFAYGGYMYVVGGEGSNLMNDVQYAAINSNGTLGSWNYTRPFVGARKDSNITAYNGFMYITGGNDAADSRGDVQFAPMLSNGTVGPWQRAFAPINGDPVGSRSPSGQNVWNGRLYAAGGGMVNGASSTTMSGSKYLEIDALDHVARYSKLVELPVQAGTVTVNYGGAFTTDTDVQFSTAGTNNVFGSLTKGSASVGSDPGGSCLLSSINTVWLTAIIDDSRWTTFGGGTVSNITDISVFYGDAGRPAPGQRLFGGKWFKNEALQKLDTCGNS